MSSLSLPVVDWRRWWPWALPVLLAPLGLLATSLHEMLVAGILGLGVLALAVARPVEALMFLVVFAPLATHVLALVYRLGVPVSVVRGGGLLKEAAIAGVVVAALQAASRTRQRLDRVDVTAFAFIGFVLVYAALPIVASPLVGDLFPDAPTGLNNIALALRADLAYIVLFLAARSLRLTDRDKRRIVRVMIVTSVIVAAGAVIESFWTDLWRRWEDDIIHFAAYHQEVLQLGRPPESVYSHILGRRYLRAGSTLTFITVGYYLSVVAGMLFVDAARRTRTGARMLLGIVLLGAAVSLTRSAVLTIIVAILVVLMLGRAVADASTGPPGRASAGFVAIVVVAALVSFTGLGDRTSAAIDGDDPSSREHVNRIIEGFGLVLENPAGLGLGQQSGVTLRDRESHIATDNAYIQTALELGVLALLLLVWFLTTLVRALHQRRDDPYALAALGVLVGFMIAGLAAHTFTYLVPTWMLMIIAAFGLPRSGAQRPSGNQPPTESMLHGGLPARPRG